MKSWFNIYIFIALYCLGMVSCTDDSMTNGDTFDKVVVRLTLSVPGGDSRVGGDYQPGTTEQNPYDNDLDEIQRYNVIYRMFTFCCSKTEPTASC